MTNLYKHLDSDGIAILAAYTQARIAGKTPERACSEAYWAGRELPSFRHLRAPCWDEKIGQNSGGKGPRSYSSPLGEMVDMCLPRGNRLPFGVSNYGSHSAAYPRTKRSLEVCAYVTQQVVDAMEAMHTKYLASRFGHMGFAQEAA